MRLRLQVTWAVGTALLVAGAVWACLPTKIAAPPDVQLSRAQMQVASVEADGETIDPRAFAARLWNPPPVAVAQKAEARGAQPLRLELIGIIEEAGALLAALYDGETDSVLVVGSGARIREHTVTAVTGGAVELSDGQSTVQLLLSKEGP